MSLIDKYAPRSKQEEIKEEINKEDSLVEKYKYKPKASINNINNIAPNYEPDVYFQLFDVNILCEYLLYYKLNKPQSINKLKNEVLEIEFFDKRCEIYSNEFEILYNDNFYMKIYFKENKPIVPQELYNGSFYLRMFKYKQMFIIDTSGNLIEKEIPNNNIGIYNPNKDNLKLNNNRKCIKCYLQNICTQKKEIREI